MNEKNNLIIPFSIVGGALIISVIIFAFVWKSTRTAEQTITVTGSAKKELISDFAILRGTLSTTSTDPKFAYQTLQRQMPVVVKYLVKKGFPENSINFYTINRYPIYELNNMGYQTQNVSHYVCEQRIEIQSNDVNKIKDLSLEISSLIEQGIDFRVESPEYLYTNLDEIKVEIQAEAAANAKMRAEKIADATGRSLGPLRNARMGVIQITPLHSTMVSDYGFNDTGSIEKEITAVVSASFQID